MRVLLLSDSMALPREEFPSEIPCYLDLLKKKFKSFDFYSLSLGKACLPDLVNQYNRYYRYYNPDIVIIHCGIVDCAPRALKKWEQTLVSGLPLVRKVIYKYREQLRKHRNISYTSKNQFQHMVDYMHTTLGKKLIVISIAPPTESYQEKVIGVAQRIDGYNRVLQNVHNYVDLSGMPESCIGSDHYHFNGQGHEFVAEKIEKAINLVLCK